jgi:hypothetical protein
VEIDRGQREHDVCDGGEMEGWFKHWRRGVGGTLRGWAKGSLGAIFFMLAACARYFEVVDDVGSALGFLPRAHARRAETCIYAMGRAREALAVLKWSKTDEQRQDYHVALGRFAPRRVANDTDPDGMIERVPLQLSSA